MFFLKTSRLAVLAPYLGAPSETFIRRHMNDLCPGRSAAMIGSYWDKPIWNFPGPVFEINISMKKGRKNLTAALKKFLKRHHIETVLAEYMDFSLEWFLEIREVIKNFYVHAHGYDVSARLREEHWVNEYLKWNNADGIITVSQKTKERLIRIGLKENKISVIPCGVDVPGQFSQRYSNSESVRCLSVGRMVEKKGPVLLLASFAKALKQMPSLELDYIGDGPLREEARGFIQEHSLEKNVRLHGFLPHSEIISFMKKADIFMQHNVTAENGDEEGLPVAILEAMANGLPVVSTTHAAIPEAVQHGITGFLVEERATQAMADSILTLTGDANLRRKMGNAGWDRAKTDFSWETERRRLLKVMALE